MRTNDRLIRDRGTIIDLESKRDGSESCSVCSCSESGKRYGSDEQKVVASDEIVCPCSLLTNEEKRS